MATLNVPLVNPVLQVIVRNPGEEIVRRIQNRQSRASVIDNRVNAEATQLPPAVEQTPITEQSVLPAANATELENNPILQNELLINEILRNLDFDTSAQENPLGLDTLPPVLEAIGTLTPSQQTEQVRNETLQNLNFVPPVDESQLLINITPPFLEEAEAFDNLTPIQASQLRINETLRLLSPALQEATATEEEEVVTPAAAATATVEVTAAIEEPVAAVAVPAAVAETAAPTTAAATTAAATPVLAGTAVASTAAETTFEEILPLAPILTPATLPFTLYPDRTPYVLNVYEVGNPSPTPGEPAPIDREVQQPLPPARSRPVNGSFSRREWHRARAQGGPLEIPQGVAQNERSIRYVINQVNEDLTARHSPLHLVLARNEAGYDVDIFDCSDNLLCRLTHGTSISSQDPAVVLNNLQHETGVAVNTTL